MYTFMDAPPGGATNDSFDGERFIYSVQSNEGPSSRCPLGAATTAPALLHLNHCTLDLL